VFGRAVNTIARRHRDPVQGGYDSASKVEEARWSSSGGVASGDDQQRRTLEIFRAPASPT
jgi:hypothetical protein